MRGDPGWPFCMPGSRARSLPPDVLEQVYAKPTWVCFCNAWRPRLAFLYAGVQGPLRVLRFFVTRCIFQWSERQSGTGTSACLHTYVYTWLPTSGRSAEPRFVFGPQHPTTLLRFLPSATFFLRWHSRIMPAVRTEKSLHGRYVILVSQDRRGPPFTDSTARTQDGASIPPARRHSMGTRHTLMPPWSRSCAALTVMCIDFVWKLLHYNRLVSVHPRDETRVGSQRSRFFTPKSGDRQHLESHAKENDEQHWITMRMTMSG